MIKVERLDYDSELEEHLSDELDHIEINLLLEGIYLRYGFDFRQYIRSSIRRRILNRKRLDNQPTITAMLNKVLHEPEYAMKLISDFSIRISEMFRDPSFYRVFRRDIVPCLRQHPEIRIWHAGCANGEEVYSMAILMREEGLADRTIIYATDMHEQAISNAKAGKFPLNRMQSFTNNYLESGGKLEFSEYYTTDRKYASFHPWLADNLLFAQHNLATDSSFNEFHVILCRNVLIYFDNDLQTRVHELFYDSLPSNGFLILGRKESLVSHRDAAIFQEFNPLERIFRKI